MNVLYSKHSFFLMTWNSIMSFSSSLFWVLIQFFICIFTMVCFDVKVPWSHWFSKISFLLRTWWVLVTSLVHLSGMLAPEEHDFPAWSTNPQKKALVRECVMLLLKGGVVLFLLLCFIWNADAAENLSVGRECVEGGVEDRGQVKPKHGAKKKQRPPPNL